MVSLKEMKMVAGELDLSVTSYSGRGMHGDVCAAIVCDEVIPTVVALMHCVGVLERYIDIDPTEWVELLSGTRFDEMGMRKIVYWPSVEWSE